MASAPPKISVLVTDIDNTMFDWLHVWHTSFAALLTAIESEFEIKRETIIPTIKEIHQAAGTTEYALLLHELPQLNGLPRGGLVRAAETYRKVALANLNLYPTVQTALINIRKRGVKIIGLTESQTLYTAHRFSTLGLDELFDHLFASPTQLLSSVNDLALCPISDFPHAINSVALHRTSSEFKKPNPCVLEAIVNKFATSEKEVLYVGDSLTKDIPMALDAGTYVAHSAYGTSKTETESYQLLESVSHWTNQEITAASGTNTIPSNSVKILDRSFYQLFDFLNSQITPSEALHVGRKF